MQRPVFRDLGLDLDTCWNGTLNLNFSPLEVLLCDADYTFERVCWTDHHPPETFSFWRVQIRVPSQCSVIGWIYHPHPDTKQRHRQPATVIELLAPWLDSLSPGCELEIRDPLDRLQWIEGVRLRARLLEALKFRVLASQNSFFVNDSSECKREWLRRFHPEALRLPDRDLDDVWKQARNLYTEE